MYALPFPGASNPPIALEQFNFIYTVPIHNNSWLKSLYIVVSYNTDVFNIFLVIALVATRLLWSPVVCMHQRWIVSISNVCCTFHSFTTTYIKYLASVVRQVWLFGDCGNLLLNKTFARRLFCAALYTSLWPILACESKLVPAFAKWSGNTRLRITSTGKFCLTTKGWKAASNHSLVVCDRGLKMCRFAWTQILVHIVLEGACFSECKVLWENIYLN